MVVVCLSQTMLLSLVLVLLWPVLVAVLGVDENMDNFAPTRQRAPFVRPNDASSSRPSCSPVVGNRTQLPFFARTGY